MSTYVLHHKETHAEIKPHTNIVHRETHQVWRFERVVVPAEGTRYFGQLMIRVSMYSHKLRMRVSRVMHPHLFLCEVLEDAKAVVEGARHAWIIVRDQLVIPFWLGVIALIVLYMGDHLHLEEMLFQR